ncbi:MAG TPA: hypothetical protein VLD13_00820 [Gaiellaceae bacterium]|nr:hypothetical protein [Gaiellaceae bacterium]
MGARALKLSGIAAAVALVGVAIGLYITEFLMSGPPATSPPVRVSAQTKSVRLTIQTVAAVGPSLSAHPDWVSYLVRHQGKWVRSTIWTVPAHALVHVTVYQFDGKSGLRNPFMSRVRGTIGSTMTVDGKTLGVINPDDASHTFAIPQLHLIVPLKGVADEAKNQCGYAPCSLSNAHLTIRFTFRTPGKGRYRWQCFVPCAAGWIYGFGGPMQTLGYMDGFLNVV